MRPPPPLPLSPPLPCGPPSTPQVLGSVDEKTDGIIIINAAGIIMAVNKAAHETFQYQKGELEGKNVRGHRGGQKEGEGAMWGARGWIRAPLEGAPSTVASAALGPGAGMALMILRRALRPAASAPKGLLPHAPTLQWPPQWVRAPPGRPRTVTSRQHSEGLQSPVLGANAQAFGTFARALPPQRHPCTQFPCNRSALPAAPPACLPARPPLAPQLPVALHGHGGPPHPQRHQAAVRGD
jgi:hypothetical protein